jgi:hypothetical protein
VLNRKIIISGLFLWGVAVWLYAQLGLSALVIDTKTGQKYCINPFSERWGISEGWTRELLFDGALFIIVVIPIALVCYLCYARKVAKKT